MPLPSSIKSRLSLPLISAPMFLVSGPELVIEACRNGVIGSFPTANCRTTADLDQWLERIARETKGYAPFCPNLIVHKSNPRVQADLAEIVKHKVPLVITSLGAATEVVDAVHSYGGLVFHDVISRRHAEKAAQAGVDGIIPVAAGAGGHAGTINPFALVGEIRSVFDGYIALSGCISSGRGPTSVMSPLRTFQSCGSSSMQVLRRYRPILVIRGSLVSLNAGPSCSLCARNWSLRRSASARIVRNLKIVNRRPPRPSRSCLKRTGPFEVNLISMAVAINSGDRAISPRLAPTISSARFQEGSPIYGMPIIEADKARLVLAIKRSMKPGFAGIDNELYTADNTLMLFGDAKAVLDDIASALREEARAA